MFGIVGRVIVERMEGEINEYEGQYLQRRGQENGIMKEVGLGLEVGVRLWRGEGNSAPSDGV
jgi:hypothetical protein